jgi:hypothetical protein
MKPRGNDATFASRANAGHNGADILAALQEEEGMARAAKLLIAVLVMSVLFGGGWLVGRLGIGSTAVDAASLTDLERQFVDRMHNVRMVGTFSTAGEKSGAPHENQYEITSVEKVGDDLWRFNTRLSCCGVNGAVPVTVPMRWSGDTPLIMMTDTSVPGMGTFTVRVRVYGDQYAGTWQHGTRGGLMSGRIEKTTAATTQ